MMICCIANAIRSNPSLRRPQRLQFIRYLNSKKAQPRTDFDMLHKLHGKIDPRSNNLESKINESIDNSTKESLNRTFLSSATSKTLKPILPDVSSISCTVVDDMGVVKAVSKKFPRALFLQQNKLFPRDLRKIDSSNVDVAPTIAVRSNGILINMLHIKALIKRNEVLIFDTSSTKSAGRLSLFMYDLESKLQTKVVHGSMLGLHGSSSSILNQSFEFKVVECILVNVMAVLETELRSHLGKVGNILKELDSQIDRANLKDLLVNSKGLTTFYQKSLLIRNTIDELLDNDEDLENMYLTENFKVRQSLVDKMDTNVEGRKTDARKENHKNEKMAAENLNLDESIMADGLHDSMMQPNSSYKDNESEILVQRGSESRDTGEVEMLLESYYKQCDEIVQQAETMINDIKSTEDIVNIILDANRNSLMVFELRVAIFTLGFTVATILPAFYGMNLKNYIEESTAAFAGVTAVSLIMGGILSIIYLRRLRDVRRMTMVSSKQLDQFDEQTKKSFLDKLRSRKDVSEEKRRKLEKDIVWKWLIDEKK